jgi:hypothetical protein
MMTASLTLRALFEEVHARYGDAEVFVRELQRTMVRHGVTQGQLAERSGYPAPRISEWLGVNRRHRPSLETRLILDEALLCLIEER